MGAVNIKLSNFATKQQVTGKSFYIEVVTQILRHFVQKAGIFDVASSIFDCSAFKEMYVIQTVKRVFESVAEVFCKIDGSSSSSVSL